MARRRFFEVKESKLWWKEECYIPEERPIKINISQAVRNNNVKMALKS